MKSNFLKCQATTKAGNLCRNSPVPGSSYCRFHQGNSPSTIEAAIPPKNDLSDFVTELEKLVNDLRTTIPEYSPPEYSEKAIVRLMVKNLKQFPLNVQLELLEMTRDKSLTSTEKNLQAINDIWYLLNLKLENPSKRVKNITNKVLDKLPGGSLINELATGLEGATVEDFLDPDTWKGLWMVVGYSFQSQIEHLNAILHGEDNK